MLDTEGHIIHIDFGFVFGLAPGKAFSLETCPFKLTHEMIEVMGGQKSIYYQRFRRSCIDAFALSRVHFDEIFHLVEMMTWKSVYPCFCYNRNAAKDFKDRHMFHIVEQNGNRMDIEKIVDRFIHTSYNHNGTGLYDTFQTVTNGISK
jgi:phosphatidylinositol kinase/protein kinase (PI-3  family)